MASPHNPEFGRRRGYSFGDRRPERPAPRPTLHPDTALLVERFAQALAEKLAAAEAKYGYSNGWLDANWQADCIEALREHIEKGDPRDVAAYCAFAWHHGWSTAPPTSAAPDDRAERVGERSVRADQNPSDAET